MRDETPPRIRRAERRLDIRTLEGAEMLRSRLRSARWPSTARSVATCEVLSAGQTSCHSYAMPTRPKDAPMRRRCVLNFGERSTVGACGMLYSAASLIIGAELRPPAGKSNKSAGSSLK